MASWPLEKDEVGSDVDRALGAGLRADGRFGRTGADQGHRSEALAEAGSLVVGNGEARQFLAWRYRRVAHYERRSRRDGPKRPITTAGD